MYFYQLGLEIKKTMEQGKLVSDDITLSLLAKAMQTKGKTNRRGTTLVSSVVL